MLTWITSNMNGYIRTDQPAEIIQEEMRRQKFNLYRDKTPDTPVSNLAILGYALPSIGIFLLLAVLIIDPFIGLWGILGYAWWLVLILVISTPVVFFDLYFLDIL